MLSLIILGADWVSGCLKLDIDTVFRFNLIVLYSSLLTVLFSILHPLKLIVIIENIFSFYKYDKGTGRLK